MLSRPPALRATTTSRQAPSHLNNHIVTAFIPCNNKRIMSAGVVTAKVSDMGCLFDALRGVHQASVGRVMAANKIVMVRMLAYELQ